MRVWQKITLIVVGCFPGYVFGQYQLTGKVMANNEPVEYVTIQLKGEEKYSAFSDESGAFSIQNIAPGEYELLAYQVSYKPYRKTLQINSDRTLELTMKSSQQELSEVVVTGTMKNTYVKNSPVKVEVLTPTFLRANPTNNMIDAIENVNGVQQQINCGVCATNDIHINGMEGPYTLVLIDGMPIVSSLASVYGFNGIPNNLIKQVEIVKGPASALYGSEAVGGVINIITKGLQDTPALSANSFVTTHGEWNADVSTKVKLGKATGIISANYFRNQYRMDFNNDNFTDIPLNNRFSLFNKWYFDRKSGKEASLALRYYTEDRFGGEMQWQPRFRGGDSIYGESIYTNRVEAIGKYEFPVKENIRLDYSFSHHDQNSYYGNTLYDARQSVFFSNLIWDKAVKKHNLLMGITNRIQHYDDNTPATVDREQLYIPGVFAQDEVEIGDNLTFLMGGRVDHHKNYGLVASPRLAVKQKFGNWTTLRFNSGRGFRLVNLFTEDHAALTGSRQVVVTESLQPEQSYNANINLNHVYVLGESMGTIDADVFYTYFSNKIIPDYETDQNSIIYDNLGGYAVVRGAALSVQHRFDNGLSAKIGATYQDVYEVENPDESVKTPQLFTPKLTGNFLITYKNKKHGFWIDYSGRVVGPQELPTYEGDLARPGRSPWYTLQNLQITKSLFGKRIEAYTGVKNLFNYTQPTPLIDPQNPFGDDFDTAYAYGPLQVRRYFFGLRYVLQ